MNDAGESTDVGGGLGPLVEGFLLGVLGLLLGGIIGIVGVLSLASLGVPVLQNVVLLVGIGVPLQGAGFILATVGYLRYRRLDVAYLRIRYPTFGDVGWSLGGVGLLFVALAAIYGVVLLLGIGEPAEHEIVQLGLARPTVLLVLVPLSLVIIGPTEELLFRGAIQTRLVGAYGPGAGIALTSIIFAVVHLPMYATGSAAAIATSIVVVFALSLILGWLYERTENLVVPAVVHGVYNTVLLGTLYLVAIDLLPW